MPVARIQQRMDIQRCTSYAPLKTLVFVAALTERNLLGINYIETTTTGIS